MRLYFPFSVLIGISFVRTSLAHARARAERERERERENIFLDIVQYVMAAIHARAYVYLDLDLCICMRVCVLDSDIQIGWEGLSDEDEVVRRYAPCYFHAAVAPLPPSHHGPPTTTCAPTFFWKQVGNRQSNIWAKMMAR